MGDIHANGKAVRVLEFSNGKKIIYKPASEDGKDLNEIVKILFGVDSGGIGFSYPLLRKSTHTWWTPTRENCLGMGSDTNEMYDVGIQYASLIGVSVLLGMEDLHHENVLFSNEDKINMTVVDTETAFISRLPSCRGGLSGMSPVSWIALQTGLIPNLRILNDKIADESPVIKLITKHCDVELKQCVAQKMGLFFKRNVNKLISQDMYSALVGGVSDGLDSFTVLLRSNSLSVARKLNMLYKGSISQLIYRPAINYFSCLSSAIRKYVMFDHDFAQIIFKDLYGLSIEEAVDSQSHKAICLYETRCLQKGEVPVLLRNNELDLIIFQDEVLKNWRKDQTPYGSFLSMLFEYNDWKELSDILNVLFMQYYKYISGDYSDAFDDVKCNANVMSVPDMLTNLFAEVETKIFVCSSQQKLVVDFSPNGKLNSLSLVNTGLGLYRGAAGIALAAWRVSSYNEENRSKSSLVCYFSEVIQAIKDNALHKLAKNIGWSFSEGVLGILYAMSVIGFDAYSPARLVNCVEAAITSSEPVFNNIGYDYINGLSGILCCYISLLRMSGGNDLNNTGRILIKRLCNEIKKFNLYSIKGCNEIGIAHGISGVVYALGLAKQIWDDQEVCDYYDLMVENLLKSLSICNFKNWHNVSAWCNGGVGMLRAAKRLGFISRIPNLSGLIGEIYNNNSKVFHLCCGSLGRTLFSIENKNLSSNVEDLKMKGKEILVRLSCDEVTSYDFVKDPFRCAGFFQGVSSVIYYASFLCNGAYPACIEMLD